MHKHLNSPPNNTECLDENVNSMVSKEQYVCVIWIKCKQGIWINTHTSLKHVQYCSLCVYCMLYIINFVCIDEWTHDQINPVICMSMFNSCTQTLLSGGTPYMHGQFKAWTNEKQSDNLQKRKLIHVLVSGIDLFDSAVHMIPIIS